MAEFKLSTTIHDDVDSPGDYLLAYRDTKPTSLHASSAADNSKAPYGTS